LVNFTSSDLIDYFYQNQSKIEEWFKTRNFEYHFYNSVDIRRSQFKIAPVDNNIFPAGFNNLSDAEIETARHYAKNYITALFPNAKKVLLFAESHSRNLFYIDNIINLSKILADFDVTITHADLEESALLTGNSGASITYSKIGNINEFDTIILNNDLSNGVPSLLENATNIIPAKDFGWFNRSKLQHFEAYNKVAQEFSECIGIDYRYISTSVTSCGCVNFKEKSGLDCVAKYSHDLIEKLKAEYTELNISDAPYLFIKADKGTYGMGVMSINNPDEIFDINKDIRKKMATLKEGIENTAVLIQEGIPTITTYNDLTAESMVYLIGGQPVSTFLRVNERKDATSNLNSPGMFFSKDGINEKESYSYQVIARLSCLAASKELIGN